MKTCKECGAEITRKRWSSGRLEHRLCFEGRQFCSAECSAANRIGKKIKTEIIAVKECEVCGNEFERRRWEYGTVESYKAFKARKTCGVACRQEARRLLAASADREKKPCEHCDKEFSRVRAGSSRLTRAQFSVKRFCSVLCSGEALASKRQASELPTYPEMHEAGSNYAMLAALNASVRKHGHLPRVYW